MTASVDPRVDAYIATLPAWQQAVCQQVRELVHAADPEVVETIKRTDRPYFVLQGNICALQGNQGPRERDLGVVGQSGRRGVPQVAAHPVGGVDYPRTFQELLTWFPGDAACVAYLERL